jgi:hypothetical protein
MSFYRVVGLPENIGHLNTHISMKSQKEDVKFECHSSQRIRMESKS